MASCCRRYRARPLKALGHDPQFLVNRPAPPATSLDHLKPFNLSTALMAVHKDCYAPIGLIQQDGPHRRETTPAPPSRRATTSARSGAAAALRAANRGPWPRRSKGVSKSDPRLEDALDAAPCDFP